MDIEKLSNDWVSSYEKDDCSEDENEPSVDYVLDLPYEDKFDELWSFIKTTYVKNLSEKVVACLAAGPLEDLLAQSGEKYINEIELLSQKDPKFRYLLGGVWKNSMSNEIWERVCKARGTAW